MFKIICQWLCVVNMVASTLLLLYRDVNGHPAKKPEGFPGIVGTLITVAIIGAIQWGAGLFSNVWHP